MLKRKQYKDLLAWKKSSKGTRALFLEGVTDVGKSFLAKEFGCKEYRSFLFIDFRNASKDIMDLFHDEPKDLDLFFDRLSLLFSVKLYPRDSLIIFGNVSYCPKAHQWITDLVQDGRYDYLETGSLIHCKTSEERISFTKGRPSGTVFSGF